MLKEERAAFISKRLNEIYPDTPVPLDHKDAYQLLVAVLLSAQCTDARVNIVTPGLFAKASNARDMAGLQVDEILEAIKSCGLAPKKSRAIKRLSEILVDNYNGEVPNDFASLEALPGVGQPQVKPLMKQNHWGLLHCNYRQEFLIVVLLHEIFLVLNHKILSLPIFHLLVNLPYLEHY